MTCEVALPEEAKHEDKSSCERENIAATGEDPAQSGGEDSEVVRTQTFQNGTVVSMLRDGTRIQTTKEGVKLVQYPTGRMSQTNVDGTSIKKCDSNAMIMRIMMLIMMLVILRRRRLRHTNTILLLASRFLHEV